MSPVATAPHEGRPRLDDLSRHYLWARIQWGGGLTVPGIAKHTCIRIRMTYVHVSLFLKFLQTTYYEFHNYWPSRQLESLKIE